MPTAVDPVVIAAECILALQSIISRNIRPTDAAVLSVTQIHSGDAYNVIPEKTRLSGTARAFSVKTLALMERRITELVSGIARAHGGDASVDFRTVFHPVVNDATAAALAGDVAAELVGESNVVRDLPAGTGSEDFSFMLEHVPGCYLLLGNSDDEHNCPLHNPGYDFNDRAAVYGASFFAQLAETALATNSPDQQQTP